MENVDDHTVRITTAGPDPSLWLKLAEVADHVQDLVGAARRDQARPTTSGEMRKDLRLAPRQRDRAVDARIGSEPRAGGWVVVRNPRLVGHGGGYPHTTSTGVVHGLRKEADAGNVAALLEGEIDLLEIPPYSAIDQISG